MGSFGIIPSCLTILQGTLGWDGHSGFKVSVIMGSAGIIPSYPTILHGPLGWDGRSGFKVSVIMGSVSDNGIGWDNPKLSYHPTRYIRMGWTLGI